MRYRKVLALLRSVLLVGLLVVFPSSILQGEEIKGRFTLPFEAEWSGVTLPAGEYRFSVNSTGQAPIMLTTPDGETVYRLVAYTESLQTEAKSQLVVINSAVQKATVHILYLADVKAAFHFNIPQRYEVSSRIIVSSSAPSGIVHIPVLSSGN